MSNNNSNNAASSFASSDDNYHGILSPSSTTTTIAMIALTLLIIHISSSYLNSSTNKTSNDTTTNNDPTQSQSQSKSKSSNKISILKRIHQTITNDIPLYILTNHRSTIVVLFGLPLSLLWDTILQIRSYYIHTFASAPHLHAQRVKAIVEQVKRQPMSGSGNGSGSGSGSGKKRHVSPLCTARPGWMSVSLSYRTYKQKWNAIQMPLYDILSANIHDGNDDSHEKDAGAGADADADASTNTSTNTNTKNQHKHKHQKTVHVEPFVTIGQLTHYLNPLGYTLPVVPEMDDLTIGGLINGTGIESSSHTYGLFHEIVTEVELCLGDGTVVVASADPDNEYRDLFYAVPWSYGTIGLLLSAKLKLIKCKEYVKLTYLPFYDKEEYIQELRSLSGEFLKTKSSTIEDDGGVQEEKKKDDAHLLPSSLSSPSSSKEVPMFLEGLVYSKNEAVVMKGEFISKKDIPKNGTTNRLSMWFKPWFYKHVQSKLEINKRLSSSSSKSTLQEREKAFVEYIPLRDYYHRHTQSLFWEMELMIPIGNHPLFRYLLGWLMPPKVSFLKISQTEMTRQLVEKTHVAQDFLVPTRKMSEFLTTCDEQFDRIYPLWLCLHNHTCMPGSILRDPLGGKDEMYIDIGVYGLPRCVHEKREDEFDMKRSMRAAVEDLKKMNGFQMLYADVFNTREEFEEMFDHEGYRMIRKKYKADTGAFKEVYDKMSVVL